MARRLTDAQIERIRAIYEAAGDGPVYLKSLAVEFGVTPATVNRQARKLGLSNPNRLRPASLTKKGRPRKFETDEERRAFQSQFMKDYIAEHGHPKGATGRKHSPETLAKISAASKKSWAKMSEKKKKERSLKIAETTLERFGAGSATRARAEKPYSRCRGGKRTDLGNRYFRSAWEANYCRFLNYLKQRGEILDWEYEPTTFRFEGVKRGPFTYTPDFKVIRTDGAVCYHEIKGWMDGKSKSRLRLMAKHYPDVEIVLVGESLYRGIEKNVARFIGGWE